MPLGSSSLPSSLVFSGAFFITGPTGPTGPKGLTGFSLTGPTGISGKQYVSSNIVGYTLGITYGNSGFFIGVTAPPGDSQRLEDPSFRILEFGGANDVSLFAGYDSEDKYKLKFKSIYLRGEVTGGISLDSFYIITGACGSTGNTIVGNTGSLMFINFESLSFGQAIDPTDNISTNYKRIVGSTYAGSNSGYTLDIFKFKISQNLNTQFKGNTLVPFNKNLITIPNSNWNGTVINNVINSFGISYSNNTGSKSILRTDQVQFTKIKNQENKHLVNSISFRVEGSKILSSATSVTDVTLKGVGITYTNETYTNSLIGSCCYCSPDSGGEQIEVFKKCIDYTTKDFCDDIRGSFGFSSCNSRYSTGDCYSGGACCVNGSCLETNEELCSYVHGTFYKNIKCSSLEFGCPNICSAGEASCCVSGTCYSLPDSDASSDLCKELNGSYSDTIICDNRNCCVEGFRGACCFGKDTCVDDVSPLECTQIIDSSGLTGNGIFKGIGTFCASIECCKETPAAAAGLLTENDITLPENLKVGDYFGGGIVAGFVGYPPPAEFDQESFFAKGEIISDLENTLTSVAKTYVPINGTFNNYLKCNCSNFAPSRYSQLQFLANNRGRVSYDDVRNSSGVYDNLSISFYNRMSDVCLNTSENACSYHPTEGKKYGYNSIIAYKKYAKMIHGEKIPNAWVLIVSPEDFYTDDKNLSFGMSMSIYGFKEQQQYSNITDYTWQNNILTPYGTSVFDGLLNTRLYDKTSIERNNWFISANTTINDQGKAIDPLAYYRFKHTLINYWNENVNKELLETNSLYFKEQYTEMWGRLNDKNTVLYNISKKNEELYNGFSDWYVPSSLELNIIYYNLEKINKGIFISNSGQNNWSLLDRESKYWTSTTGGKLIETKTGTSGYQDIKYYEKYNTILETNFETGNNLIDSWRRLKASHAHRAYLQNFANGGMVSEYKTNRSGKLRACRMIPIYFKNTDFSNQFEYSFKQLNSCSSCK